MNDTKKTGEKKQSSSSNTGPLTQYERYLDGEITYAQLHQISPQTLREEQQLVALSANQSEDRAKKK